MLLWRLSHAKAPHGVEDQAQLWLTEQGDSGVFVLRIALCVKRDLYGAIAASAFMRTLKLSDAQIKIFCSVKTRAAEENNIWLGLFKVLERDVPFEILLPSTPMREARHPLAQPWEPLGDLRADGGAAQLLAWRPDIVVSMRFSLIFPRRVIQAVPGGILNVHPGPLPSYRGLFAPFWQAMAREPELVSTLHRVDAGIDTGPILAEHRVARDERRSLMWHIADLYRGGAKLAAKVTARQFQDSEAPAGRPQPEEGRYWSFPSDRELAAFQDGGMKLFCPDEYRALLSEAFGLRRGLDIEAA
jgi:methionyl-tRNA formyltransferase